jgi:hypothetical protein
MSDIASRSLTLRERDARVIADIARLRFSPVSLVGGRGSRLIEEGGRELLDFGSSFGPAILGHGHPSMVEAVSGAVANMGGASLSAYANENAVALAEDLLRVTPGRGERRVWFGHSGSDANDTAMKVHLVCGILARRSVGVEQHQRPYRAHPLAAAPRPDVAALSGSVQRDFHIGRGAQVPRLSVRHGISAHTGCRHVHRADPR